VTLCYGALEIVGLLLLLLLRTQNGRQQNSWNTHEVMQIIVTSLRSRHVIECAWKD